MQNPKWVDRFYTKMQDAALVDQDGPPREFGKSLIKRLYFAFLLICIPVVIIVFGSMAIYLVEKGDVKFISGLFILVSLFLFYFYRGLISILVHSFVCGEPLLKISEDGTAFSILGVENIKNSELVDLRVITLRLLRFPNVSILALRIRARDLDEQTEFYRRQRSRVGRFVLEGRGRWNLYVPSLTMWRSAYDYKRALEFHLGRESGKCET